MDDLPVFDRLKEITDTIEYCIGVRKVLPALVLLYTLIDSISWLATDSTNRSVRKRFTRWVDDWMLRTGSLSCTSLELYAARCGVLHSLTSDSDLSATRKVRRILYSFHDVSPTPLQEAAELIGADEYVAIRIEDLYGAFMSGLSDFLEHTAQHPHRKQEFEQRASGHFSYLPSSEVKAALSVIKKTEDPSGKAQKP